jgi:hypothetical protein
MTFLDVVAFEPFGKAARRDEHTCRVVQLGGEARATAERAFARWQCARHRRGPQVRSTEAGEPLWSIQKGDATWIAELRDGDTTIARTFALRELPCGSSVRGDSRTRNWMARRPNARKRD